MKPLNSSHLFIIAILILFVVSGCKSKTNSGDEDDIVGKWMIYDASRNGRTTTTLKDGYISLSEENVLETNILGEVTRSNFQYNGDQLVSAPPFEYDFTVISLTADSLHINGMMKAFDMNFYLKRYSDSIQLLHDASIYDSIEVN